MNLLQQRGLRQVLRRWLPDRIIIKRQFAQAFGRKLNLRHPKTLNEKIQWLKLYYRPPLVTRISDKYAVREYVAERVGSKFLNELYGTWTDAASIDLSTLPDRFVLKVTHGCDWNIICRDKSALDWPAAQDQLNDWLQTNHYRRLREWAYKNIPPRIICERLLEERSGKSPPDFKFYCFDGEPRLIQVDMDRFSHHCRNYYDLDWEQLPLRSGEPNYSGEISRPINFEEMLSVAQQLTEGLPFCRADFYSIEGRTIFGELTLYSGAGFVQWEPESFDYTLGSYLRLPMP